MAKVANLKVGIFKSAAILVVLNGESTLIDCEHFTDLKVIICTLIVDGDTILLPIYFEIILLLNLMIKFFFSLQN